MPTFAIPNNKGVVLRTKIGAIAQLVEQRTENPCVPGSIPGGTTKNRVAVVCEAVFSLWPLAKTAPNANGGRIWDYLLAKRAYFANEKQKIELRLSEKGYYANTRV